jgi:SAM-dependent methyltransferase
LRVGGVVEPGDDRAELTATFRLVLRYRDLLQAKLDFATLVAGDFLGGFTALIQDPRQFMAHARLFKLFDYQRCFDDSPESFEQTRRWMRFTTALTRYEAPVCLRHHDFSRHRRMLDVGGNSGEFALRACKENPALEATVLDLPLVCAIGRQHVRAEPEAERITFLPGDARAGPLPTGFDLITFKSMLHDWPDEDARSFLSRAAEALEPGGILLIFERGPLEVRGPLPYGQLPMLLFFRSFRQPGFYTEHLAGLGLRDVAVQSVELESPFFLVTARKHA